MKKKIKSALLARLYDYWEGLHRDEGIPSVHAVDPTDIPINILPFLMLLDVQDGGRDFRIRLMGTEVVFSYGEEATGQSLNDIDLGDFRDTSVGNYQDLVDTRLPQHITGSYTKANGRNIRIERLALPLSHDGKEVTRILSGLIINTSQD